MTDLKSRTTGSRLGIVHDPVLQTGGITINQDAYTAGLDRRYDVRGLRNMNVEIKNTGGANSLTYKIEKARKSFTKESDLVNADFNKDIKGDTPVAFGADDLTPIIDISPQTTAIRIRVRRTTAGLDTTMAGFVGVN